MVSQLNSSPTMGKKPVTRSASMEAAITQWNMRAGPVWRTIFSGMSAWASAAAGAASSPSPGSTRGFHTTAYTAWNTTNPIPAQNDRVSSPHASRMMISRPQGSVPN